uniref:cation transporter n=1 Tax=Pigmentiphaga litoralis TaxID=516702 RepID=UPI00389AB587
MQRPGVPAVTPAAAGLDRRERLVRRIRGFSIAVIGYNVLEAALAIAAGLASGSVALIGFGLDSVVEVASAAAIFWQFSGGDHERREKAALRVVAGLFFVLAAYLVVTSGLKLLGVEEPVESPAGIALTAVSLVVMPLLSYGQRRTGRELGSRSAVADSKQTLLCTYLSAVVLVGLAVNALFGWAWADPVAALVIAAVAVKEGVEAARGDTCCTPAAGLAPQSGSTRPTEGGQDCDCCAPEPAAGLQIGMRPAEGGSRE